MTFVLIIYLIITWLQFFVEFFLPLLSSFRPLLTLWDEHVLGWNLTRETSFDKPLLSKWYRNAFQYKPIAFSHPIYWLSCHSLRGDVAILFSMLPFVLNVDGTDDQNAFYLVTTLNRRSYLKSLPNCLLKLLIDRGELPNKEPMLSQLAFSLFIKSNIPWRRWIKRDSVFRSK